MGDVLDGVTREGLSPRDNIYTEERDGVAVEKTAPARALVQEEHGCSRQMAESSGWSSERRRREAAVRLQARRHLVMLCPGKQSGSCCPLNAVQGV